MYAQVCMPAHTRTQTLTNKQHERMLNKLYFKKEYSRKILITLAEFWNIFYYDEFFHTILLTSTHILPKLTGLPYSSKLLFFP